MSTGGPGCPTSALTKPETAPAARSRPGLIANAVQCLPSAGGPDRRRDTAISMAKPKIIAPAATDYAEGNSLQSPMGKYREIHRFWPLTSEFPIESTSRIRDLQSEFPAKWNREIIVPEQGIKSADQGPFLPDQGRPSGSGQICQNGQRNEPLSGVRVIWPLFAYRRSGTEN